jgi:2-polyprenyl-3-methyl-5-hydroxy-6-metoxy-1,4-benzoquinol methylase
MLDHFLVRSRSTRASPAVPLNAMQVAVRHQVLDKYADGTYATAETPCLCGADGGQLVAELDRYGFPSPSVLCRNCGVVRTSPRLSDATLVDFYQKDYRPLYGGAKEAQADFLKLQRHRGENISKFLSGLLSPRSRVIDVGCGAGFTLLPFREAGHIVAGCDLGAAYLEAGRERGLDLRHGDITALADLAPFDLVIMSHVFEHIADPRSLMNGIKPMLAPGGLVYIEVPGLQSISMSYGDPLRYFQNAHLWNFDLESLTAAMANYGYGRVRGTEFVRSAFTPDETAKPDYQGGYERAVRSLSRAEATRQLHGVRIKAIDITRKLIGADRATKVKKFITNA